MNSFVIMPYNRSECVRRYKKCMFTYSDMPITKCYNLHSLFLINAVIKESRHSSQGAIHAIDPISMNSNKNPAVYVVSSHFQRCLFEVRSLVIKIS